MVRAAVAARTAASSRQTGFKRFRIIQGSSEPVDFLEQFEMRCATAQCEAIRRRDRLFHCADLKVRRGRIGCRVTWMKSGGSAADRVVTDGFARAIPSRAVMHSTDVRSGWYAPWHGSGAAATNPWGRQSH